MVKKKVGNQLYFAYGMNTNVDSMASRCPNAISIGKAFLDCHKFVFRGVADIDYTANSSDRVEGALWLITPECEASLDALEGYPTFYTKEYNWDYHDVGVMYYIMTEKSKKSPYSYPSQFYKDCLEEGYKSFGLDLNQLKSALKGLTVPDNKLSYAEIKEILESQYDTWPPRRWE